MNLSLEEVMRQEKEVFNHLNNLRSSAETIPLEFDYDYVPSKFDFERYTGKKMGRRSVLNYIKLVNDNPGIKIVDVCCGPGWVSLLAATRGARVYGYDISNVAIENAKLSRERNLQKIIENKGTLEYYNQSVHTIPFLDDQKSVDLFIGWSAFHHLDQMELFFERMNTALKDGGYIISVDDIGSKKINRIITWGLKFILPIKGLSYTNKISKIGKYFQKLIQPEVEWHTPMEQYVGKHENAAQKIEDILSRDYEIVHNYRYCGFVHYFVYDLAGPDWFRKIMFDLLWNLDRLFVWTKLCKGNLRFILAKKKQ
ncbi:hypothetical protein KACHI17_12450 [Sediminibacterium sp. KACHI17]|uniref:Methyltransferase type 11 domain-containing protein n=1 Tax=Sediminibacterium sp. KACHI17 TaxID=1751071 RepID=A0AAT9GI84_9BACT